MDVTFLYNSAEIHGKILELFGSKYRRRRRVILVAYVGIDAEKFLPYRRGIELYCWPQPGATHPEAIARLRGDVKIHFVNGLHSKLYWVAGIGALITSANLSASALTSEVRHEVGVLVPDFSEADINKLIQVLNASEMTDGELKKLRLKHDVFWAKHGKGVKKAAGLASVAGGTYAKWYADSAAARLRWKINFGGKKLLMLQPLAQEEAKRRYGKTNVHAHINGLKGDYSAGDWILYFEYSSAGRYVGYEWIRIDYYIAVGKDRRRGDCDYQGVQVERPSFEMVPPFRIDAHFRKAFSTAFDRAEDKDIGTKLSASFLKAINNEYDAS